MTDFNDKRKEALHYPCKEVCNTDGEFCTCLEELEPDCEECGKQVDEWDDLTMPYCSAHFGECYELMICAECLDKWKCPKEGQYEIEFDQDGLPF